MPELEINYLLFTVLLFNREHPALQNMEFLTFFVGSFLPFWIRIQPTKINSDLDQNNAWGGGGRGVLYGWVVTKITCWYYMVFRGEVCMYNSYTFLNQYKHLLNVVRTQNIYMIFLFSPGYLQVIGADWWV